MSDANAEEKWTAADEANLHRVTTLQSAERVVLDPKASYADVEAAIAAVDGLSDPTSSSAIRLTLQIRGGAQ